MSVSRRLRDFLDSQRVKYVVVTHSQAFTAQEVAQRMHVPGREMAKTVVIRTPSALVLAVVRAPDRVDMDAIASLLGSEARLATEQEFSAAFQDCELGAMPPFGSLYDLRTVADEELARDDEISFNAGTHTEAIRMAYVDFERLEKPRIGRITRSLSGAAR